ncbi:MAG: hypothetical protein M3312_04840 [Actinomycetota bacterium]|nr:hypothetical protein [Actinomycetota bacterium]
MELDKDTIVGLLRERGEQGKADEAARDLPDRVDTERDSGLLARFGVDPGDLVGKFTGGRDIPGL